jgi:hypothetical protein
MKLVFITTRSTLSPTHRERPLLCPWILETLANGSTATMLRRLPLACLSMLKQPATFRPMIVRSQREERQLGTFIRGLTLGGDTRAILGNIFYTTHNNVTPSTQQTAEEKRHEKLMETLAFDRMDFRRATIEPAHTHMPMDIRRRSLLKMARCRFQSHEPWLSLDQRQTRIRQVYLDEMHS